MRESLIRYLQFWIYRASKTKASALSTAAVQKQMMLFIIGASLSYSYNPT